MSYRRTIVTTDNIDVLREALPADHAAELVVGCETWGTTDAARVRGQITVWPERGVAAVCRGGDSVWGVWRADSDTILLDDGRVVDGDGQEIDG